MEKWFIASEHFISFTPQGVVRIGKDNTPNPTDNIETQKDLGGI